MTTQYAPGTTVEPLLRVNDVALILRRSRTFVYRLVNEEELHPVRVGARLRFLPDDVRDYLERHRLGASSP